MIRYHPEAIEYDRHCKFMRKLIHNRNRSRCQQLWQKTLRTRKPPAYPSPKPRHQTKAKSATQTKVTLRRGLLRLCNLMYTSNFRSLISQTKPNQAKSRSPAPLFCHIRSSFVIVSYERYRLPYWSLERKCVYSEHVVEESEAQCLRAIRYVWREVVEIERCSKSCKKVEVREVAESVKSGIEERVGDILS